MDEQFCFHDIPERLDPYDYEAFDRGDTRFYVACSNVETGESRVSGDQRYVQRCRIFPCDGIPSVCVPYGRGWWNEASDGGCTDSIPCVRSLRWAIKMRRCADPSSGLPQETGQFLAAGGGISQISGVREGRFAAAIISIIRRWNGSIALEQEGKNFYYPSERGASNRQNRT